MLTSFVGRPVMPMHFSRGCYVMLARNAAASYFLHTDCEYLLFIDLDIRYEKKHIDMIMESDEPLIAGLYFLRKSSKPQPCVVNLPGTKLTVGGIIPVRRTGTGFMRIHRSVFEKMKPTRKMYIYEGREEYDFFPVGVWPASVKTNRGWEDEWIGEDWYFSELAREAGFNVMLDTRIQLLHEGTALYPLKHQVEELSK